MHIKIGFIGQGWIGKHYADDFEKRSYSVVRYSLDEPYLKNKEKIKECKIVFIAVPTPTTVAGFDCGSIIDSLKVVANGSTVVIKSTLLPGTTQRIQEQFPHLFIIHSPEFLRETTAAHDASHPERNIVGIPIYNEEFRKRAEQILSVLPHAKYNKIMSSLNAEMIKYVGNCFLYTKVIVMNIFYDVAMASGADWNIIRDAIINDSRIGDSHTLPVHQSGHDKSATTSKRGAGGHCFIKDFEAFRALYAGSIGKDKAYDMLSKMVEYNNYLLTSTDKDIELLEGVYGKECTHDGLEVR